MALTILIAEDDDNDFHLMELALQSAPIATQLLRARDGTEAVKILGAEKGRLDLVILDLKMPKMSGHDVLEWIAMHEEFRVIPALVFSSSIVLDDVKLAYKLGATTYFVKPIDLESFQALFRTIVTYWTFGITSIRMQTENFR